VIAVVLYVLFKRRRWIWPGCSRAAPSCRAPGC